jgi:ABC-type phosphate transport system substrate-binding protein
MKTFLPAIWLAALAWLALPVQASSGEGAIAVILAPGHGRSVKKDELTLIYKRKKLFWPDGSRIQPVNLPAASSLRREFSLAVLGASPEELEKYWNDMYFHGISPPYVLASEEAVLRFVAETPDAIGYVSFCSVAHRAKIVLVVTPGGHISEDIASVQCGR